ncbi:MAG: FAD-linked oxidase C-terminal domain-containing protein [Planctomycetota bacterium]
MNQERERIQADLRGLLAGEVRCDDVCVQMYATDASIYQIRPLGVVRPSGVSDVVACVQYALENEIPLHPRGAGTGLAGESLGPGLVLDFSRSMHRIVSCDEETVRVQPGVVLSQLNRFLADRGRCVAAGPVNKVAATMGGVIAVDGAGSRWIQWGSVGDAVVALQLVLADATVVEAGRHGVSEPLSDNPLVARRQTLVRDIANVVQREQAVIEQCLPRTKVDRSGYHLREVLQDGRLNLARLVAGSEGTLAMISEATVRTRPLPPYQGAALLFFDRLESAARGALEIAGMGVSACDMMDRRLLSIARDTDVRYDLLIPRDVEAMLLVEIQGEDQDDVRQRLQDVVDRIQRRKRLAFDSRLALEKDEFDLFWRLVRRVVPGVYSLKGSSRPLPFVEGIAVPPTELPDFLVQMQNVLKSHRVTASLFAHAAHGQLHMRPFLDLASPEHVKKMQDVAVDLYEKVLACGGTISGEHADGLSRSWFMRRQFGPLYEVFAQIKQLFDPRNILNPGKIVADAPQPLTANLRTVTVRRGEPAVEGTTSRDDVATGGERMPCQLLWQDAPVEQVARMCHGCGNCRTQAPSERMCPIFRYSPREEASPRAKANLMRAALTGQLDLHELKGEELKQVADLCVNCYQCQLECPAHVNIPKLMIECKSQYVATNGLQPTDWFLARLDVLCSWGSSFHRLANWAIADRTMRWLIERTMGIAQGRKLPQFAPRSFIRVAHRRRLTRPTRRSGPKVVFFADIYANWHDVQLAEACVSVLEHNGISVYVPPGQTQSGMAAISMGALDIARKMAVTNVQLLAEAARQGYQIVASEPAAALCLTREYLNLLDDDDARLVAENSSEICSFLWKLHLEGRLKLDFNPLNVALGYHLPCHVRAMKGGMAGFNLLRLIPGLTVRQLSHACSGMAGTFGLKRSNYRGSLRAGWGLISALRSPAIQVGTTECSACKIQMEQGTAKPTVHPLKFLALSYGLMPEIAELLTARSEERVVT